MDSDLHIPMIEANLAYCAARQGDAEQRMAELVTDMIGRREENTFRLGEALQEYQKPILDRMQLVQLELGKKENSDPKKQEELTKQLEGLNAELENAGKKNGRYEPAVQKLIDNDKELSSRAAQAMANSGNFRESLQGDIEATNKLFAETLKHGSQTNQTSNSNGRWFPLPPMLTPMLRAIKTVPILSSVIPV